MTQDAENRWQALARATKQASRKLATLSANEKNMLLREMAVGLESHIDTLKTANAKDCELAKSKGLSTALIDRLVLDEERIIAVASTLREVALLPDPVGKITESHLRPNGIRVGQVQIPLGVILMIYESRPNVTVDASALCIKSGNGIILRGGSEAFHSNQAIVKILKQTLEDQQLPTDMIGFIDDTDRQVMNELLTFKQTIDLVIPRGGKNLIEYVSETSRIPVIQHYEGVCHLYVDRYADEKKAVNIAINGKVQRPGVCNALETCLIDALVADEMLPEICQSLMDEGVEIRGCRKTQKLFPEAKEATEEDYYAEYLDKIIAVKVVNSLNEAIEHIMHYGSNHTDVIVTENYTRAKRFVEEVDSSVVMVNASSRFSDGGELGLGAEIGISTSKLHAYGPMGLESLTTRKFVIEGNGQIRD
ncbi:MAG: glutamate-5-semialdehyde dehydrogenase [Pseudomonadota bacterium]